VTFKSFLYKALAVSNDVNAVKRGKVGRRIARRVMGRISGRAMGKILR
jgi:hypothetical protein